MMPGKSSSRARSIRTRFVAHLFLDRSAACSRTISTPQEFSQDSPRPPLFTEKVLNSRGPGEKRSVPRDAFAKCTVCAILLDELGGIAGILYSPTGSTTREDTIRRAHSPRWRHVALICLLLSAAPCARLLRGSRGAAAARGEGFNLSTALFAELTDNSSIRSPRSRSSPSARSTISLSRHQALHPHDSGGPARPGQHVLPRPQAARPLQEADTAAEPLRGRSSNTCGPRCSSRCWARRAGGFTSCASRSSFSSSTRTSWA